MDIFQKDFLIILINEGSHWFLAIVCFPGLSGPLSAIDNNPVIVPQPSKTANSKSRKSVDIVTNDGESLTLLMPKLHSLAVPPQY